MSRKKSPPVVVPEPVNPARTRPAAKRNKTTAAFLVSDALWERLKTALARARQHPSPWRGQAARL